MLQDSNLLTIRLSDNAEEALAVKLYGPGEFLMKKHLSQLNAQNGSPCLGGRGSFQLPGVSIWRWLFNVQEQTDNSLFQEQTDRRMHIAKAMSRLEGTYDGCPDSPPPWATLRFGQQQHNQANNNHATPRNDQKPGKWVRPPPGLATTWRYVEDTPEQPTRRERLLRDVNGMLERRAARAQGH